MNRDLEQSVARAAPGIFVILWSTGFIGTKYVLEGAEPMTYLAIRMALVAALMVLIVLVARPKLPNLIEIGHSAVAGLLIQAIYLGGVSVAMYHSVPAGLAALIPGLQPILTSTLANRWLGERVTKLQWVGLIFGLLGVLMVLHGRQMTGEMGWAWLGTCVALVSITLGTLYQKRYCGRIDWRAGNLVQFAASAVLCGIGAWLFETRNVDWSLQFTLSLFLVAKRLPLWPRDRAVDRLDRRLVLADPARDGDAGGKSVLSRAGDDGPDGVFPVRRAAGFPRHPGHGAVRSGRVPRQQAVEETRSGFAGKLSA